MKLTEWYSGNQKPVRVGVYQRDYGGIGNEEHVVYCFWDGINWCVNGENADGVIESRKESYFQNEPWRGIAK